MAKDAFDNHAEQEKIEHIQADMQNIGMQKNRRHQPPVLPGQNGGIIFRTKGDQDIRILAVGKNIRQDILQRVRARIERHLIGGHTPDRPGRPENDPGGPGKISFARFSLVP